MQVRTPAAAGMFYPNEKSELRESIHRCFHHTLGPGKIPPATADKKIFGAICPHAGYMYSGPVAAHAFDAIAPSAPELFVIIGPNHWGIGKNITTAKNCRWSTPLGEAEVDSDMASKITGCAGIIDMDCFSHAKEHSIEVQLPMIQETVGNFKFVPISMLSQDRSSANVVGLAIAEALVEKNAMIIGSSDFTHYESNEIAYRQDRALIEPILRLDVGEFYDVLEEKNVSSCGHGAMAATMAACKKMGATEGKLLKYATSGDVTGDMSSVVGYGAIVFT